MLNIKRIAAAIGAGALLAASFLPALAVTEAGVTATVTPQLVSITVTDGTVDYGVTQLSSSKNTVTLGQTQTATNNGNVAENFGIRSLDAIGSGGDSNWNLVLVAPGVGPDAYRHEFSTNGGVGWSEFNVDNVTYVSLVAGVAALGSQTFDLQIYTPTSITGYGQRSITVTVQATAS